MKRLLYYEREYVSTFEAARIIKGLFVNNTSQIGGRGFPLNRLELKEWRALCKRVWTKNLQKFSSVIMYVHQGIDTFCKGLHWLVEANAKSFLAVNPTESKHQNCNDHLNTGRGLVQYSNGWKRGCQMVWFSDTIWSLD